MTGVYPFASVPSPVDLAVTPSGEFFVLSRRMKKVYRIQPGQAAAEEEGRLITPSLTQQDIANLTGTSRQTVTSVLNDLKKSNLIYFNRNSILIRDLAKLS